MEKIYVIYCHTNIKTNQKYIGQTKNKTPKYRWNNGNGYTYNTRFYNDILLYGWENGFEHQIIKDKLTAEEANYWEDYYINYYDTLNPEKGYNLKRNCTGVPSAETKINMSIAQYQRYTNQEERQKTSKKVKQYYIDNPEKAKERGQDIKKWRLEHPEKVKQLNQQLSTQIECIETGQVFCSISEASRILKINRKSINRCILMQQRTANNLHWRIFEDNITIEEIDNFFLKNKTNTKRVQCIETGEIFLSIAEATRKYGGDIKSCLKGRQKTAGGLHWKYVEE